MNREDAIVAAAFRRERIASARLGFIVRSSGIAAIALTLVFRTSGMSLLFYFAFLAGLFVSGWLFFQSVRQHSGPGRRLGTLFQAGLIAADMVVIVAALVLPAPGSPENWPDAMQFRLGSVGFLFLFLAFSALTYSPGLALWAGVAGAIAWLGGVIWTLLQPGSFTLSLAELSALPNDEILAALLAPGYVSVIAAVQEALLLLIVGAVIATAVWRGRRQAFRQIETARERTKLARYFSPDLAAELTHRSASLEEMQTRRAVVIFADIFGFTRMAEQMTLAETIVFLREFHALATSAVFRHGGTLNKFIGDEVMVSFGAIHDVKEGPAAALTCAIEIAESVTRWSEARVAAGKPPVRVGIGLHIGDVVVGNIGDVNCLELAILGDVVNSASRMQQLTRTYDATIIASREALEAARQARPDTKALLSQFTPMDQPALRGKAVEVVCAMMR